MKKSLSLLLALVLSLSCCLYPVFAIGDEPVPAESVSLDKTELTMLLGGSLEKLEVRAPEGSSVIWASDDWRVARVSNGYVISVGEGSANVTATVGDTVLTCVVKVFTEEKLITNDIVPRDTDGNYIFAQWSTIQKFGDKFYRYGVRIARSVGLWNSQKQGKGTPSNSGSGAIVIYSSDDLVSWKHEADISRVVTSRLGISYNAKNDYYVLTGDGGGIQYATSPTPTGPWTRVGTTQTGMNELGPDPAILSASADSTTFYDWTTGKAYVPFVCGTVTDPVGAAQNTWETLNERDIGYIGVINEDGTRVSEVYEVYNNHKDPYYNLLREGGREANYMFQYDGWYYYVGSALRGWNAGPTCYMGGARTPTAKTYTNEVGIPNSMFPMRGTGQSNSHTTQCEGAVTVVTPVTEQAPAGQMVLQWGDRFTNDNANGYGFTQFGPLSFLDPATAPPMTEDDLPKYPDPQSFSTGECVNPDNPWKDLDTFYPFLPEDYPYKDTDGNPEWKRPEWPIPVYNDLTQFYFDVDSGSWAPGPNNNYLTNSYFENDRLAGGRAMQIDGVDVNYPVIQTYVNEPTGWKSEHIAGQVAQINYGGNRGTGATTLAYQLLKGNQNQNSAWAGNYSWYHGYTKRNAGTDPYKTKTYQTVDNLPNGVYTVYGWVQSSGGQNEAYMYAKSGGNEYRADVNRKIGDDSTVNNTASTKWELVVISENIVVTDGTVEVGMYSDAAADQWAEFDDFALIHTGDYEPTLTLDKTELSMLLGGELARLTATVGPDYAPDKSVKWTSDDLRVARVSNGYIVSVSEGTAVITAESADGVKATCAVTVLDGELLITNDVFPKDTNGDPIFAQMGSIYRYEEDDPYYYWYGMNFPGAQTYYNSLQAGKGTTGSTSWRTSSIRCYKSLNLVDWEPVGGPWAGDDDPATHDADVVRPNQFGWTTDNGVSTMNWIARMGVAYNSKTKKYVMLGQSQESSHGTNRLFYAVSDRPEGPFTFVKSERAMTVGPDKPTRADGTEVPFTGDMTMYYDRATGSAYIIYCINGVTTAPFTQAGSWEIYPERDQQYVAVLNPDDFLSVVANYEVYDAKKDTYYNLKREGGREANCMFSYNGWYYYAASGLRGWNTSPTFYMGGAKSPADKTYTNEVGLPNNMTPMRGTSANFSHTTQVVGFVTADTPNGQMVLEFGDRWSNNAGYGIGYSQFAPLSFLDPATAAPMTEDESPKTPNPQSYNGNKDNPALVPNPWGDMKSFFPFLPDGYPYEEWKRPEWPIPVYNNMSQFRLDIANGTWEPGPNNNYLENPYFENDRLAGGLTMTFQGQTISMPGIQTYVNEPNGWKAEHITGQVAQINYGGNRGTSAANRAYQLITRGTANQTYNSAWAGNYAWSHGYTKRNTGDEPYKAKTYQTAINLPDGIYTFYGWVRSSGGQNECYIYAGGAKADMNTPIGDWTLLAIENIEVTGGQLEVGFYSDAAPDQWAEFDDFALIRNKAEAEITSLEISPIITYLVTGCDAYIPVEAEAENPDGLDIYAALYHDGQLISEEAKVVGGKARIFAQKIAYSEGVYVGARFEGGEVTKTAAVAMKVMTPAIWTPVCQYLPADGAYAVIFAEKIAPTAKGGYALTVNGVETAIEFTDDYRILFKAASGGTVKISGVKYPEMFPSYSFTFTLSIP